MTQSARGLFRQAIELGWDKVHGGFFYTLDWNNQPIMRSKLWWPACEGAGAAAFLNEHQPSPFHESWYRRIWSTIATSYLDHRHGGWLEELDEDLRPSHKLFAGKADIYHALQACLIPLFPAAGSLTRVIPEVGAKY